MVGGRFIVRRSSAEIRRAIDRAREAADACQAHREEEDLAERAVHLYAVDLLRWTAGEPGTRFGRWLNQPNSKVREIDK
jgi:hypothetical protein